MRLYLPLGYDGPKSAVELTDDINRRTGSCIDAEILLLLSESPSSLEWLLAAIQCAGGFPALFAAADHLRAAVCRRVQSSPQFPDHLAWLSDHGFSREDSRQIRYIVETFHNLEPVFAILAALVQRLLASSRHPQLDALSASSLLMDCSDSTPAVPAISEMQLKQPGLLHPFYKAIAAWPDYATKLLNDWESLAHCQQPISPQTAVREMANTIAQGLAAETTNATEPRSPGGSSDLVWDCLNKSCEVIALTTSVRRAFIKAEVRARSANTRAALCG